MSQEIVSLYRHIVKGLNPEALRSANLHSGGTLEGDRSFAFQFLDPTVPEELQKTPAASTPWMPKFYLAVQHDWPDLARIIPTWNATKSTLKLSIESPAGPSIEENVSTDTGRQKLAEFLLDYLKDKTPFAKARHPLLTKLRLIGDPAHATRYTDGEKGKRNYFRDLALLEGLTCFTFFL